jgi:hypothetical protein
LAIGVQSVSAHGRIYDSSRRSFTTGFDQEQFIYYRRAIRKMEITAARSVVLGLGVALGMFGQIASTSTVPFEITSYVGSYTDPYGATINGVPNIPIICDDYADHVSSPQSWTALVNNLDLFPDQGTSYSAQTAADTVTTVYYNGDQSIGYTQTQEYIAAADLAYQIYELGSPFANPPTDEPQRDDLSAAMWALFEPTQVPLGTCYGCLDANAASLLAAALATTTGASPLYTTGASFEVARNVTIDIYTPTLSPYTSPNPNTWNNLAGSDNAPQEMITVTPGYSMPEPSTWAVLGFDLVGAGIAGLYFRRRAPRSQS